MRRILDGVLLLDKPLELSSQDALSRAKWILQAKKGGHTGTLDPLASGLLPLCFGEATKFSNEALNSNKSYEALVVLGVTTRTADREGEVLAIREVRVNTLAIRQVLEKFQGDSLQIPPMYSALKREGRPLYEYARVGLTIEREARPITIEALEWLDEEKWHNEDHRTTLTLRITCSKGTYIRTLAEDIGEALGCGAHLGALRRTQVGAFCVESAVTLDTLQAAPDPTVFLHPVDTLLRALPKIELDAHQTSRFLQGQRVRLALSSNSKHRCRIYDDTARFLGTANDTEGLLTPLRLISTNSK